MPSTPPRVTVGLPVYNGEAFLQAAVDSLLAQDFEDFELLIADNGSTDATEEIARRAVSADARVRYERSEDNRGAAWNFNRCVGLARGELFKWAAADDLAAPSFLSACLAALDADPGLVLAFPGTIDIDEEDRPLCRYRPARIAVQQRPSDRFADCLAHLRHCYSVFGVMRREALRQTRLIGPFTGSDKALLVELALRGRFLEVPVEAFLHRQHDRRSMVVYSHAVARMEWFDTSRAKRIGLPYVRLGAEYARAIGNAPLPLSERAACASHLLAWTMAHRRQLAGDLLSAGVQAGRRWWARKPARPAGPTGEPTYDHVPIPLEPPSG